MSSIYQFLSIETEIQKEIWPRLNQSKWETKLQDGMTRKHHVLGLPSIPLINLLTWNPSRTNMSLFVVRKSLWTKWMKIFLITSLTQFSTVRLVAICQLSLQLLQFFTLHGIQVNLSSYSFRHSEKWLHMSSRSSGGLQAHHHKRNSQLGESSQKHLKPPRRASLIIQRLFRQPTPKRFTRTGEWLSFFSSWSLSLMRCSWQSHTGSATGSADSR